MSNSAPDNQLLILVVDDEAILRLLATDVLEESGYGVIEAPDADTALQILAEHRDIGVVFTDIHMPGAIDGMDLAREVHRRWPKVRLIVTSGRAYPDKGEIPDEGRFVPKPYSPQSLSRNSILRPAADAEWIL